MFEILLILQPPISINVDYWYFCPHFSRILPFFAFKTAAVALISSNKILFWLFKVMLQYNEKFARDLIDTKATDVNKCIVLIFFYHYFPGYLLFFGSGRSIVVLVCSIWMLFWWFKLSFKLILRLFEFSLIPWPLMSNIAHFQYFSRIYVGFWV